MTPELRERVGKRIAGQADWLKENHPEVFDGQKHLHTGSPERAYWHFGYLMAMRDIINQLDN